MPNYELTISAGPEWEGVGVTSAVFAITAPNEEEAKEMLAVVSDTVASFGLDRVFESEPIVREV